MDRNRMAGILLVFAGALFFIVAFMENERSALRLIAGGLLCIAGVVRLVRSRRRDVQ